MILHSIIDINDVFYQGGQAVNQVSCKAVGNVFLEGEETKQGFMISRIMSTDPKDYLDGKYTLGGYIN